MYARLQWLHLMQIICILVRYPLASDPIQTEVFQPITCLSNSLKTQIHPLPLTPSSPWMLPLPDWMGSHPYKEDAELELSPDLHRAARIQYRILPSSTGLVSTVMVPNTHANSHSIANTILYTNIIANLMMQRNLYFFLNYECFWEYIHFFLLPCAKRNCCNLL